MVSVANGLSVVGLVFATLLGAFVTFGLGHGFDACNIIAPPETNLLSRADCTAILSPATAFKNEALVNAGKAAQVGGPRPREWLYDILSISLTLFVPHSKSFLVDQ